MSGLRSNEHADLGEVTVGREPVEGPAELVLMASVASRFFVDGASKVEIADALGLSRFKVARLLEKARETGLVRIEISYPGAIDVDLSTRLQSAFGLRQAVVLGTRPGDSALAGHATLEQVANEAGGLRAELGRVCAELLGELLTGDDVLGVATARSLIAMSGQLTRLPACPVVQLTGALTTADLDDSSIDLVRRIARVGGGPAYFFHAPMIVDSARTATALRAQPEIRRTMDHFSSVTTALVGIGSWDPPFSTVYDSLDVRERRALWKLGVRAEVSGILLDDEGGEIDAPLTQRVIAVTGAQLRRVPSVLAIAYGVAKARATRIALRSGLVNGLITHAALAEALLDERQLDERQLDERQLDESRPDAAGTGAG